MMKWRLCIIEKLVFLESDSINEKLFTTSKVIAENGKVEHHTVTKLVQKYDGDIKDFGILRFGIEEIRGRGQPEKVYKLNEQQATLLITYMKNTLPVRRFKKTLVKQFYLMQQELNKRIAKRLKGKEARKALTASIDNMPESPHKKLKYKHYTDLVYKIVLDKNTKQLKAQFGLNDKDNLRDYLSSEEIEKIDHIENQISVFIDFGYSYKDIKLMLNKKYLISA